jgi:hypothetical protein
MIYKQRFRFLFFRLASSHFIVWRNWLASKLDRLSAKYLFRGIIVKSVAIRSVRCRSKLSGVNTDKHLELAKKKV